MGFFPSNFCLCVLFDSTRDFAGTSFRSKPCDDLLINWVNTMTVDRKTNTYSTHPPCDESTGNMATAAWWVNSIYILNEEIPLCGIPGIAPSGPDCSEGKPTVTDMKWFFGNMFRVPALQEEFWKLWDIVVKHRLVEKNGSEPTDLFSTNLFVDQIFEPIRTTVKGMYRVILHLIYFAFGRIHL